MKAYLAAPYQSREQIRVCAAVLQQWGVTVTSTWLLEDHEINAGTTHAATALPDEAVAAHAQQDMDDIDRSDLVVLFTAASVGVEGGGGRHVETGYALASGKPVIVIGEPENVFHRLGAPAVQLVPDWPAAVDAIGDRLEAGASNVEPGCTNSKACQADEHMMCCPSRQRRERVAS